MANFSPDIYAAQTPMGQLTVAAAGTPVLLNSNWTPAYDDAPVTAAAPQQYAYAAKDIVFSFPAGNAGGIYLVQKGGDKNHPNTILAYFPKQAGIPQLPVHLSTYFPQGKFAPFNLAVDADQNGDSVFAVGIN